MKNFIFLILISAFIFFAISCTKDLTISGKLVNRITKEPIEGLELTLKKPASGKDPVFSSDVTDSNGNFSFELQEDNLDYDRLYFDNSHPGYQHWNWWVNGAEEPEWDYYMERGGELEDCTIEFYPMTYFEVSFVDVDAITTNSSNPIIINNIYTYSDPPGFGPTGEAFFEDGCKGPFSFRYFTIDNNPFVEVFSGYCYKENIVEFNWFRGIEDLEFIQSIECTPGDTTKIVIEY